MPICYRTLELFSCFCLLYKYYCFTQKFCTICQLLVFSLKGGYPVHPRSFRWREEENQHRHGADHLSVSSVPGRADHWAGCQHCQCHGRSPPQVSLPFCCCNLRRVLFTLCHALLSVLQALSPRSHHHLVHTPASLLHLQAV